MKYDLVNEGWNRFLVEQDTTFTSSATDVQTAATVEKPKEVAQSEEEKKQTKVKSIKDLAQKYTNDLKRLAKQLGLDYSSISSELAKMAQSTQITESKKKKGDRCTRIAKRKYKVWPSAYASGAVVKCRQGKIWKGISESASDEEIDFQLLLEELEKVEVIEEEWSERYKRSIDCNNPKGFSQKAHCQGRKKNEEIEIDDELIEEAKKKRPYKPNFSREKKQGLHGWFARNKGKGWINCRTGGPCGRSDADEGGKYPACRPTKAQCKSAGKGPLRKKKSSKPISWTKKKKKD
jgi:hypothetical protein